MPCLTEYRNSLLVSVTFESYTFHDSHNPGSYAVLLITCQPTTQTLGLSTTSDNASASASVIVSVRRKNKRRWDTHERCMCYKNVTAKLIQCRYSYDDEKDADGTDDIKDTFEIR